MTLVSPPPPSSSFPSSSPLLNSMSHPANNVYVHASPPKAISGQASLIRSSLKTGDLDRLEQVVLEGQGARLLGLIDHTSDPKVKAFLKAVPSYMAKVDLLHDAVIRGSLRETQSLIDKRKLAGAKDAVGRGLGHKAVLYGHKGVLDWLGRKFPEVVMQRDSEGRTPLHYAAAHTDTNNSPTPHSLYTHLLTTLGASPDTPDIHGRRPAYYLQHPHELDIESPFLYNNRSLSRNNNNNNKSRRITPPPPPPLLSNIKSTPTSSTSSTTPPQQQLQSHQQLLFHQSTTNSGGTITRAQIRIWIHEKDIPKLESIVWNGKGDKLLLETTNNGKVRRFLDNVPHLLGVVKQIHIGSITNDTETLKQLKQKTPHLKEVFSAKDQHGLTPIHKAVGLGNRETVEWFAYECPELLNENLLAYVRDPGVGAFLKKAMGLKDNVYGGSYDNNVDMRYLRYVPDAPRVVGELGEWDRGVEGSYSGYGNSGGNWGGTTVAAAGIAAGATAVALSSGKKRKQSENEFDFDEVNKPQSSGKLLRMGSNNSFPLQGDNYASSSGDEVIKEVGDGYVMEGSTKGEEEGGKYGLDPDAPMDFEVDLEDEGEEEEERELERELKRIEDDDDQKEGEELDQQQNDDVGRADSDGRGQEEEEEEELLTSQKEPEEEEMVIDKSNSPPPPRTAQGTEAEHRTAATPQQSRTQSPLKTPLQKSSTTTIPPQTPLQTIAQANNPPQSPLKTPHQNDINNTAPTTPHITNNNPIPPQTPLSTTTIPPPPSTPSHLLQTHSISTPSQIPPLIQSGDMETLVTLVLEGKGSLLLNHPTSHAHPEVTEFLHNVPAYMAKIASIHSAANNGNLRDLQALLDRKRLAQARDEYGRVALHMAVLGGHAGVVRYLCGNYGQSLNSLDANRRTPLHYAATLPDQGAIYKILIQAGADPNIKDVKDNTPGIYLRRKDLLTVKDLVEWTTTTTDNQKESAGHVDQWERPETPPESELISRSGSGRQITDNDNELPHCFHPDPTHQLHLLDTFYYNQIAKEESLWVKTWKKLISSSSNQPSQSKTTAKTYFDKYLPPLTYESIKTRSTPRYGATLLDCIKFYPQFFLVAPDSHSYWTFREIFMAAVKEHNGVTDNILNVSDLICFGGNAILEKDVLKPVDVAAKFVRQMRLRLSRNLRPYAFVSILKREGLEEIGGVIAGVISNVGGSWERIEWGDFQQQIQQNNPEVQKWRDLIVPMEASKISRFWPKHRQVYIQQTSTKITSQVWVHAQDHLDIIVTSQYGRISLLLQTLQSLYEQISPHLDFHYSSEVGYLTVDPFRCGTGLKITTRLRLPYLMSRSRRQELTSLCEKNFLSISKWNLTSKSAADGEEVDVDDWIEVENVRTFGLSEWEVARGVVEGLGEVFQVEEGIGREVDAKASGKVKKGQENK